ncbi:MAG: hypothetical protein QOG52_1699 [Frankiaceae bacterium]|jgi:hypothetical protein|nr:hypothetical protein [Frankiaceae bacterium]
MSATPESQSDDEKRAQERRRLIDLTRREKGLPERRKLGTDRRAAGKQNRPDDLANNDLANNGLANKDLPSEDLPKDGSGGDAAAGQD